MKTLAALAGLLLLAALPARAAQTPVPSFTGTGGSNPIQGLPATQVDFNTLISLINGILLPLQPYVPGGVNFISLTPGVSGVGATVGVQPGGDANAAVKVSPAGNGGIILFSSAANLKSTGLIKIGNIASWAPAPGLDRCPGSVAGRAPAFGVSQTVTGYLIIKDWLDRPHGQPGC